MRAAYLGLGGALLVAPTIYLVWTLHQNDEKTGDAKHSIDLVQQSIRIPVLDPNTRGSVAEQSIEESRAREKPVPRLSPTAENARVREIWERSGAALNDALDEDARLRANTALDQLKLLAPSVEPRLDLLQCRRAGCIASVRITAALGTSNELLTEKVLQGHVVDSTIDRWPGMRVYPPALSDGVNTIITLVFLRSDVSPDLGIL